MLGNSAVVWELTNSSREVSGKIFFFWKAAYFKFWFKELFIRLLQAASCALSWAFWSLSSDICVKYRLSLIVYWLHWLYMYVFDNAMWVWIKDISHQTVCQCLESGHPINKETSRRKQKTVFSTLGVKNCGQSYEYAQIRNKWRRRIKEAIS